MSGRRTNRPATKRANPAVGSAPAVAATSVTVPPCWATEAKFEGNRVRQLLDAQRDAVVITRKSGNVLRFSDGNEFRLVRGPEKLLTGERALQPRRVSVLGHLPTAVELQDLKWIGRLDGPKPTEVLASLDGAFSFLAEDPSAHSGGLRVPQLGAIHAVLGFWTTGTKLPATVVMPTGTGKTEAMLGLLAAARPDRLLVLVPSDALRDQIAGKFETFGVLQDLGVVARSAMRPAVGRVVQRFASAAQARDFASRCNVIVVTPQALTASPADVRSALLAECSHLFVDEAHHVAAATWKAIRDDFADRNVVQFTATPFREDGRRMEGRILYSFPLREAQRLGYFSKINYYSVIDFENQDRAIAMKAIEQLRADLKAKRDHIIMARVKQISRVDHVLALYQELAADLKPVALHSHVPSKIRKAALEAIRSRESRVIVCVDMLGEGFDLPSLKIAAIHDAHQSLGVTLQFVGRFARASGGSIGEATVVVARPDSDHDEKLRRLYAEDADWNQIIRNLSEAAVGVEEEVSEFETAFSALPEEVSLANLLPKMSTVVYRTKTTSWAPEKITELFAEESLLTVPVPVNATEHVAWFVTEIRSQVPWGDERTVQDLTHHLYLVHWDSERQLLYINSSEKQSLHEELAAAVCGPDVKRITGEPVYRVMADVKRLVPTNVGVLDTRNRWRRFSMHVGADVTEGFPPAEAQTKSKTNLFAYGFEDGARMSIGASLKGRIWSYRVALSLKHWMDWCNHIGEKLSDDSINLDEVMKNFIRPKVLEARPALVPLAVEWPWEVFLNTSDEVRIEHAGDNWPLVDIELKITNFSTSGPIEFQVVTPAGSASYQGDIGPNGITYKASGKEVDVVTGDGRTPLSVWLGKRGLTVHFEQDAVATPDGFFLQVDRTLPPFDPQRLTTLDWTGIDLRKESQGPKRAADSIQARMIKEVRSLAKWDLVIDDDGSGEIADIVAMRVDGNDLKVLLVHCKFSSDSRPGGRVEDLYELCGQAQKSVNWRRSVPVMFRHLVRREKRRQSGGRSGLEVGKATTFYELQEKARMLRPEFSIAIAQPGFSKGLASQSQLDLLASTEVYVRETANAPLVVYCSK